MSNSMACIILGFCSYTRLMSYCSNLGLTKGVCLRLNFLLLNVILDPGLGLTELEEYTPDIFFNNYRTIVVN